MESTESVHPGHSLCHIMACTLRDIAQMEQENDTQEQVVRQELKQFTLDLLSVVKEAIGQNPELMSTVNMDIIDFPGMGLHDAKRIQLVVFDPNYYNASWGYDRLGVHADGSLGYLRFIERSLANTHTLLVDSDGNWVDEAGAQNTGRLINYASWFLHGMCRKISLLQEKVDAQITRRQRIEESQNKLRLLRAQLREASRRNQGL